jgi:lipopolysaccharide heptosyltransferase II
MAAGDKTPKTKDEKQIEWEKVRRVLVVRLRSIGDTVLATPSLIALKRFLPDAEIDILLEDWVAPLLEGHDAVDNIIPTGKTFTEKLKTAREIRRRRYDVVFNLHGGSTSTFLTYATGAKHRVGYEGYRYSFLYTDLLSSSADFWHRNTTHSAEQQLALLGFVGVPVEDRPRSRLIVSQSATTSCEKKITTERTEVTERRFALIHPTASFQTKTWPVENFAKVAEDLAGQALETIAIAATSETETLDRLKQESRVPVITFNDLSLREITALASRATLFVGNDSGIAHIAAAVGTPTIVIFGSSNRDHWYPWTDAPNEIVFSEKECLHFKGEIRAGTEHPTCIQCVTVEQVIDAIDRVLERGRPRPQL